jgi:hypothetical protein
VTTSLESWTYVVAIVPSTAAVPSGEPDDPISDLRLVSDGELAALVGTPPGDRPLGRAADLLAHDRLLAAIVASGTPVVPMRFGAVLTSEAAVAEELLAEHRDELLEQLHTVTGRVQYTVKVRYEQDAVLREVIAEHPEIRRLRAQLADTGGTFDSQLQLGEVVVRALERRRPAVAAQVLAEIGDQLGSRVRELSSPEDVLDVAFLIASSDAAAFEDRIEKVAKRHFGRLHVRMLGPLAAFDFVAGG